MNLKEFATTTSDLIQETLKVIELRFPLDIYVEDSKGNCTKVDCDDIDICCVKNGKVRDGVPYVNAIVLKNKEEPTNQNKTTRVGIGF